MRALGDRQAMFAHPQRPRPTSVERNDITDPEAFCTFASVLPRLTRLAYLWCVPLSPVREEGEQRWHHCRLMSEVPAPDGRLPAWSTRWRSQHWGQRFSLLQTPSKSVRPSPSLGKLPQLRSLWRMAGRDGRERVIHRLGDNALGAQPTFQVLCKALARAPLLQRVQCGARPHATRPPLRIW